MYKLQLITLAEGFSKTYYLVLVSLLVVKLYSASISLVESCLHFLNKDTSLGILTSDDILSKPLLSIVELKTRYSSSRRASFIDASLSFLIKDDSSTSNSRRLIVFIVTSTKALRSRFLRVSNIILARSTLDIS